MDKIIDGVDVSECNAYKDKHCLDKTSIMFTEYNLCSNFSDCYFKQLKRLEQENNSLQAQLNNITVQSNNAITALEQENERLKEEIRQKKITIMMNNDHYLTVDENNRKYSQCLKEIKEICKQTAGTYTNKKILDKISECIGVE